jgi:hypothetical protein
VKPTQQNDRVSTRATPRASQPAIAWSWPHALVGVVYAIPAATVALRDPQLGIPLAVGVLPAAMVGIPPRRRSRIIILVIGVLAGASLFLGGVLAHLPLVLAAIFLAAAVVGAALLASALAFGRLVLVLCAPLVAAGLSYDDYASSAQTLLLLSLGAAYACLVTMFWPAHSAPQRPQAQLPDQESMLVYGIRLGLAAAIVYAIAASMGLDHPGWAPAACLLVARPQVDLLQSRGVGRVASVVVGALAAVLILNSQPPEVVFALVAVVVLGAAAATVGSRWYITSAFTTLLVFLMLLNGHLDETTYRSTSASARPSSVSPPLIWSCGSSRQSRRATPQTTAPHRESGGRQCVGPVPTPDTGRAGRALR